MPHRGGFVTGIPIAIALTLALFAGPAGATSIVVRPVAEGTVFAGSVGPVARIVRDAPAFDALLAEWGLGKWEMQRARSRAKGIDFRRRSLVVLLDSAMPDSGYLDLVGGIDIADGTATLTATLFRRPGFHLDAFANPWAIVSVPRAALARVAPEVRLVLRCAAGTHSCLMIGR